MLCMFFNSPSDHYPVKMFIRLLNASRIVLKKNPIDLQLPRCSGFVIFPPTHVGERMAKAAAQALDREIISGMKVSKYNQPNHAL